MSHPLTAGEECQLAAKTLAAFVDTTKNGAIPPSFINSSMAIAVLRGETGVAVVRLSSGDWSAPCAVQMTNPIEPIRPAQETVLLFMSEPSVLSLVSKSFVSLNQTHRFLPGPLNASAPLDPGADVYVYVRYNSGFTDAHLVQAAMSGWRVSEDPVRHARWHGSRVSWFDVLTNKISVDRSSVGNALYLVLNLAAGQINRSSTGATGPRNFPDVSRLNQLPVSDHDRRFVESATGHQRTSNPAWERQTWQVQNPPTDSFGVGMAGNTTAFYAEMDGNEAYAGSGQFANAGMMGYQQQQELQPHQLQQQLQQQQLQQQQQRYQQLQMQQQQQQHLFQQQHQNQNQDQNQQFSNQAVQSSNYFQNRQPSWQEQLLRGPHQNSQEQFGGYRQG